MRHSHLFPSLLLGLAVATPAAADQLAVFDLETARRAVAELADQASVVLYCAPCRGDQPVEHPLGEFRLVREARDGAPGWEGTLEAQAGGWWSIDTDLPESFDLAYVYIWKDGRWTNLGIRTGRSPRNVPMHLDDLPAPLAAAPALR